MVRDHCTAHSALVGKEKEWVSGDRKMVEKNGWGVMEECEEKLTLLILAYFVIIVVPILILAPPPSSHLFYSDTYCAIKLLYHLFWYLLYHHALLQTLRSTLILTVPPSSFTNFKIYSDTYCTTKLLYNSRRNWLLRSCRCPNPTLKMDDRCDN